MAGITKNDIITLEITGMSAEGMGVGRHEGLVVFTTGAAPGDVLTARVLKVHANHAYAKTERLLTPSPNRTDDGCGVYGRCGGCCYRHITYESELEIKRGQVTETLRRLGGADIGAVDIIASDACDRYRNKAQLPFGIGPDGRVALGFYAGRSHRFVPVGDCPLTPSVFTGICGAVLEFANSRAMSVYNEETGRGLLRHLYLRRGHNSGEIMVSVVINSDRFPGEKELARALVRAFPGIVSVIVNKNHARTNIILGESNRSLYGDGYITDSLCGLKLRVSPHSFYQVNSPVAERVYEAAYRLSEGLSGTALDLFCGIGAAGLVFADRAAKGDAASPVLSVLGIDSEPAAIADARINAGLNGLTNISFTQADIHALPDLAESSAVIVDPPRKGLGHGLVAAIAGMSPERVVYISCDPATLARDIRYFGELGYGLCGAVAADMFPRTRHVETVVSLRRSGA